MSGDFFEETNRFEGCKFEHSISKEFASDITVLDFSQGDSWIRDNDAVDCNHACSIQRLDLAQARARITEKIVRIVRFL